jgi:hypothetical protein
MQVGVNKVLRLSQAMGCAAIIVVSAIVCFNGSLRDEYRGSEHTGYHRHQLLDTGWPLTFMTRHANNASASMIHFSLLALAADAAVFVASAVMCILCGWRCRTQSYTQAQLGTFIAVSV